jgi:prepilin-type N-terminal cleavage/methylation domain-containing protein
MIRFIRRIGKLKRRKEMRMARRKLFGFTLIELIIVIVIVGILALVAIPKYFANIEKTRKAEAVSTMRAIREAVLGYYAANGKNPANNFPITVVIDNETVMTVEEPKSSNFTYKYDAATKVTATKKAKAGTKSYTMEIASGNVAEQ